MFTVNSSNESLLCTRAPSRLWLNAKSSLTQRLKFVCLTISFELIHLHHSGGLESAFINELLEGKWRILQRCQTYKYTDQLVVSRDIILSQV